MSRMSLDEPQGKRFPGDKEYGGASCQDFGVL